MSLYSDIPQAASWRQVIPIEKGWAKDKKYCIQTQTGEKQLLRIAEKESLKAEEKEYRAMAQLSQYPRLGCAKLLSEGYCNKQQNTYRLFTWLEGQALEETLPQLSPQKQYELGLQAGNILRQIHQIPAPTNHRPWNDYFNWKIDRNINRYHECALKFEGAQKIIDYINAHRHLLDDRPQSFHHGDYHIGNMLLTPDQQVGVIDFNRLDFGDPWEEFNRIPWCASASPSFAKGRIKGYFQDQIPPDFFPLMCLYLGSNQLGGLAWAAAYGEEEVRVLLAQTKEVMGWYRGFEEVVPGWY